MEPRDRPYGDDDRTVARAPGPPPNTLPGWSGPPPQGPDGWQPGPPAKPPRNWMWIVIAATVVIVIASITIVVVTTGGDDATDTASTSTSRAGTTKASVPKTSTRRTTEAPPPPPAPGPIAPDALQGLLVPATDVSNVLKTPGMEAFPPENTLITGTSAIPLECRPIWAPADDTIYGGAGFTGMVRQTVRTEPKGPNAFVQSVLAFPNDQAAKATMDRLTATWDNCKALDFQADIGGKTIAFKTAAVGNTEGIATLQIFARSYLDNPGATPDPNCERAVTARRNLVVDVLACSPNVGSGGLTLARAIDQKIVAMP